MLVLKFRDLTEFNFPFPQKYQPAPAVWQTYRQGISLLVYKISPLFLLAGTELCTVFRVENYSICKMEENQIGWIKQDKNHLG